MKLFRLFLLSLLVSIKVSLRGQEAVPALTPPSTNSPVADQEARDLKPRDSLRFNVLEDPAGRGQFPEIQITDLGEAMFPVSSGSGEYIRVKAAGRRLADLRRELKQKLDAEYYQNATISLDLLSLAGSDQRPGGASAPGKVTVYGAVTANFPIKEDQKLTLSDVFTQLSGQLQYARLTAVEVMRIDPATRKNTITVKNVKKLLDGKLDDDVELKDGDRIRVPEKFVNF